MTLDKAINRLSWRFGQCRSINPVKEDLEAFNVIIEHINHMNNQFMQSHSLFAKLYIRVYRMTLEHYNATIFDDIPQKVLHKFLAKPLENHIEDFTDYLNSSELFKVLDSDNPDLKDFKEAIGSYENDDVKNNLNQMISKCISQYQEI